MGWVIAGAALLVLLFVGLFVGLRDIPPSGKPHGPMSKNDLLNKTWASVNEHFARRKKLGR